MNTEGKLPRKYRYYEALGIDKDSSFEIIKKSYRMLVKKFHPDINNDPKANEILKKINEAYNVLSNPGTRLLYDNSETECPKCWTHEVTRIKGENFTTYQWTCRHCGCNFQFLKHVQDTDYVETEKGVSYQRFNCPQCKKELEFDTLILLYRCKNKKCRRVFTYKELCKYYRIKSEPVEVKTSKEENTTKSTEKTKGKANTLSEIALIIFVLSLFANGILLYNMISNYSSLSLGLFLFLISFALLSFWVYKKPNAVKIIKALIIKK